MIELLRSILRTHDLVLAGYSGFDSALADIIADNITEVDNHIYWCNPHPPSDMAPLWVRIGSRTKLIRATFDELMRGVARPILEKPSYITSEATYVQCLFDWRLSYSNKEYIDLYGKRSGKTLVDTFARRSAIESRIETFLEPNRPLAIIVGPSGFGKTTIGIRLHQTWLGQHDRNIMLIRSLAVPENGDLEQHVAETLGGLGPRNDFSLYKFERWLKLNGLSLVLFVDGINEFSPDLLRCVQFFRQILRLCYFLPNNDGALRVIATIRQETWAAMLPHLDLGQLRETLWSEQRPDQSAAAIACGPLTDDELQDAVRRLHEQGYATIDVTRLSPSLTEQLHDPYLLSIFADTVNEAIASPSIVRIYDQAFESKLRRAGSLINKATLKDVLGKIALNVLASGHERFREIDLTATANRTDIVRLMMDLHIFVAAGGGFLRFDHDRTFEYFLGHGFSLSEAPRLETLADLSEFLFRFSSNGRAVAAARLYYELASDRRFSVISHALRLLDREDEHFTLTERSALFGFAREVLLEMAVNGDVTAQEYLEDAVAASGSGQIGSAQLRTIVQAAATLPIDRAIPLLTRAAHPHSGVARTEANIYAVDMLVKKFLGDRTPELDFLADEPYATFFGDRSIARWQRMGRLLTFIMQVGADNTHPDEYTPCFAGLNAALDRLLGDTPWPDAEARAFGEYFLENCDRLLFNATPHGIKVFFGNPRRSEFLRILDKLDAGDCFDDGDLLTLEPYTQQLSADIEYHLAHALLILASFNDLDATLALVESRFRRFTDDTSPIEVDWFQAAIVYVHIVHDYPYDEARFGPLEESVIRDWPSVLMFRPGIERGERRGFHDPFDRIFEDGFGVVYPYGTLLPSLRRRRMRYREYLRNVGNERTSLLPLYSGYLEMFIASGRVDEAFQMIHALSGVIVPWPLEGLLALSPVIGHPDPMIRRAVVRTLAEAFNRHPDETLRFLKASGAAVSDDDLLEIKVRQDARIGRRQISEEEWGRIAQFLFRRPGARPVFARCLRALISADSFANAVRGVFLELNLA